MKQPIKPNKNKDVVTIGNEWSGEDRPSYICNFCSRNLVKLTDRSGKNESYFCNSCGIDFQPDNENVRRESKLFVPDRNQEPAVTSIQYTMADEVEIRHTVPKRGGFAELERKGIKIKNYHTTEKE